MCDSCHTCVLLRQSPESPSEHIGINFAIDVMKQNRQLILVRESVLSYTLASIIVGENHDYLRDTLVSLTAEILLMNGLKAFVRIDSASGFVSLKKFLYNTIFSFKSLELKDNKSLTTGKNH